MTQRFAWHRLRPKGMFIALLLLASCSASPEFDRYLPHREAPATQSSSFITPANAGEMPPVGATAPLSASSEAARTVKVGLLLPLSGEAAAMGTALRDAAVLALFDKYATLRNPSVKVELITKDTGDSPEGARDAAAAAVKEGATLLLGPLFAPSVEAVKPLAKTGKITIISFSNRKEIAGDGVYVLGFDPAEQAQRVANYAYRRDINSVAALVPNDAYGREVTQSFERIATLLGRKLDPVARYAPDGKGLAQQIRTFAADGSNGARFRFSALLLPEAGEHLSTILESLQAANISSQTIQFLGTGVWDDKQIIRNHALNGAWLASSPPDIYARFEQRYKTTYGSTPPRLASLAYDAVALATTLATSPQGFSRAALENPAGFFGPANGIFRLKSDGTTQRGLAVLQVDGTSGFRVIEPAPTRF